LATETVSTTVYICDLCRTRFTHRLDQLFGPEWRGRCGYHPGADICKACQCKPIADLVEFFRKDRTA
jgi:hypothetical protein